MPGLYDQFQWVPGEALNAMGNYNQAQASSTDMLARAAQQQAETQTYTSQTAQQMRQAQQQADMTKAQNETSQNQAWQSVNKADPAILPTIVKAGMYDTMTSHYKNMTDNRLNTVQNTVGQSLKSDGTVDPDVFSNKVQELQKIDPEAAQQYAGIDPSTDKGQKTAQALIASAAMTTQQRFAERQEQEKLINEQTVAKIQGGYHLAGMQAVAGGRVQAAQIGADWHTAGFQTQEDIAAMKVAAANAAKNGKALTLQQAGGDFQKLAGGAQVLAQQIPEFQSLDSKTLQAVSAKAALDAQQEYTRQANAFEQDPKNSPRPVSPGLLVQEQLQRIASDPTRLTKGHTLFHTGGFNPSLPPQGGATTAAMTTQQPEGETTPTKKVSDLSPAVQEALSKKSPEEQKAFMAKWNITQ